MSGARFDAPWSRLRARSSALVFDIVLVAYALWCVQYIATHYNPDWDFLRRYPGLLMLTSVVAVLWHASGASLGIAGHRLRFVHADSSSRTAANLSQRLTWGVATAVWIMLFALAIWFVGVTWGSAAIWLALAVAACWFALSQGPHDSVAERIAGVRIMRARERDVPKELIPWTRRPAMWALLILLLLTFWVGVIVTQFALGDLKDGFNKTKPMFRELVNPDTTIVSDVVARMIDTVFMALMASVVALPFAFGLSFLGARNLTRDSAWGRVFYAIARVFMNVTRSIEPLIWAIIFVLWVGAGPFAGMLALTVHSIAALGKLYSEAIESIDDGPLEAMRATGADTLQTIRYGVVPQVIPPFLSFTVYRWDINVRMATILGIIGGGGIGDLLVNYSQIGSWSKVGTIIFFITIVVWAMDMASGKARELLMKD